MFLDKKEGRLPLTKNTKKIEISQSDLRDLLLAFFAVNERRQADYQALLDPEAPEHTPENREKAVARKVTSLKGLASLLAEQLLAKKGSEQLFSATRFAEKLMETDAEQASNESELAKLKKYSLSIAEIIIEVMKTIFPDDCDPYDHYWKMIGIVADVAAENGLTMPEAYNKTDTHNEIQRRLYTKEEFIKQHKAFGRLFLDADKIRNSLMLPMFELLADDEEERLEMEQDFDKESMPEFRLQIQKALVGVDELIQKQADSIYG